MKYSSDLTYPEIKVEKENKEYAKLLLNSYSGRSSETSAIFQYSYQSVLLDNKYSEIIKNISVVEIKHLKMLGETIKLLGIEPMFIYPNNIDNGFKYWNSSYINYTNNLENMIKTNIEDKENTINNYNDIINQIEDNYVINILKRIILDEEIHLKIFKDILNEINFKNLDIDNS